MLKPLVKYFMKKSVKDSDRQPSMVHGDSVQSIMLIGFYDGANQYEEALKYAKELRKRGIRKVDTFIAFPSAKVLKEIEVPKNVHAFSNKDFTMVGRYLSEQLQESSKLEYDILVDLTEGKSLAADVVIAKSNAKWKAGRRQEDRSYLLDFMIDQPEEKGLKDLIHHLDKYIMKFNTSNAA